MRRTAPLDDPRPVEFEHRGALIPLYDGASRVVSLRIVVSFLVSSASVRLGSRSTSRNTSVLVRTLAAYPER
ncbi:MAG TPA: hypothetical protein VF070_45815 [Streptosporangiaceae bacterium]